jgi:hypothetical protein
MEVICIIGERVYHAPGSECQRRLDAQGSVLTLTDGQAQEVGMEPCGFCLSNDAGEARPSRNA